MSHWHDTKSLYSKLLQFEHDFPKQVVYCPPGAGRGIVEVAGGCPQPHACALEICKLDIVWQVIVEPGYMLITVDQPRYWNMVLGEIQHIVTRHV